MSTSIGSAPGAMPGYGGHQADGGQAGGIQSRVAGEAGSPTLLVVDDEPGIVDSLQKIFEREHLRVLTARAGPRRWRSCAVSRCRCSSPI